MRIKNSKGQIYYGMHFYPGVVQYDDPVKKESTRYFLNENTIRQMDPTFAGRPLFVRHVDEVEEDLNELRKEADGWVVESFFNAADGKHWAKFIVVSEKGQEAVRSGWKLSNAYIPKSKSHGGLWNGVPYVEEVTSGEYEHLAIVQNPRYEESIILTPDQFKAYNAEKEMELKRISNSKGENSMFSFFKKEKVANEDTNIENMSVVLPNTKIEKTITQLINEADEHHAESQKPEHMANGEHCVMVGEHKMTVNELVKKHLDCVNDLDDLKKKHVDGEGEDKEGENKNDESPSEVDPDKKENEESEDEKEKKEKAKQNAKHFNDLRDAERRAAPTQEVDVDLSYDQLARGQARYGSQN